MHKYVLVSGIEGHKAIAHSHYSVVYGVYAAPPFWVIILRLTYEP